MQISVRLHINHRRRVEYHCISYELPNIAIVQAIPVQYCLAISMKIERWAPRPCWAIWEVVTQLTQWQRNGMIK